MSSAVPTADPETLIFNSQAIVPPSLWEHHSGQARDMLIDIVRFEAAERGYVLRGGGLELEARTVELEARTVVLASVTTEAVKDEAAARALLEERRGDGPCLM
jgi:hypothetical protein